MKTVALTGLRMMQIIHVNEPLLLNPDDVKIELLSIGVCG